jgi:hypothetical protein
VSPTSLDGARAASSTLDWLVEHGHDGSPHPRSPWSTGSRTPAGSPRRIEDTLRPRCRPASHPA